MRLQTTGSRSTSAGQILVVAKGRWVGAAPSPPVARPSPIRASFPTSRGRGRVGLATADRKGPPLAVDEAGPAKS